MKLDKQPPDADAAAAAPTDPPAASSGKPKKWANVRRKFALIVANRNHHHHHSHHHHHHPPPDEEAASQAESFCRPYIQDGGAAGLLLRAADREPDREMQYAQVTRENSERNKEITSPLYSPPTATTTTKRKKKKGSRKIVRFIEQPYVILDQEDACSVDSREDVDVEDVDVGVMAGVKALQLRTGSGPATIRVVRQ